MLKTGVDGKTCTRCCEWKTFDEYSKDRHQFDGYATRCKSCKAEYKSQWDAAQKGIRETVKDTILVISDTQAPYHHPDTIPFLKAIKHQFQPGHVVHIGDEVDLYHLSKFDKLPELDNPSAEWKAACDFMYEMYDVFDTVKVCNSNHVLGRIEKARMKARLLPCFLKSVKELFNAPVGWEWEEHWIIGNILFQHGHRVKKNLKDWVLLECERRHGRLYSTVCGHHHSEMGIYKDAKKTVGQRMFFGAYSGSLIDPQSRVFEYGNKFPELGCLLIVNEKPVELRMELDTEGRWTGEIV